jgi:hypothetical protein
MGHHEAIDQLRSQLENAAPSELLIAVSVLLDHLDAVQFELALDALQGQLGDSELRVVARSLQQAMNPTQSIQS